MSPGSPSSNSSVPAVSSAGYTVTDTPPPTSPSAVDAENGRMVWGVATVNSWYRNEHGRSAQNWPFSLLEYWRRTKSVDPDDYSFAGEAT